MLLFELNRSADINHELLTFTAHVYKAVSRKWNAVFQTRNSLLLLIEPTIIASKCLNGNAAAGRVGAGGCTTGRALMKLVIKGTPMPTPTTCP